MIKKRKAWPEFNHYIALSSILGASLSLFIYYQYSAEAQAVVVLLTAFLYVIWGIIHHKLIHYLTREIIFEYSLVAAIGALVILSILGY